MAMPEVLSGRSAGWKAARALADRVAPERVPVLFLGPTGGGKTILARHLHACSPRRTLSEVALPSIPEALRHSELFGHVRGAFTGAERDHTGAIVSANKGTLFLDEIGVASQLLQEVLLTTVESASVRPVGGSRSIPVDVRYLFATNADLAAMRRQGTFRDDLYWRISTVEVHVPPLAERVEDILPFAEHFLAAERRWRGPDTPAGFSPAAIRVLEEHSWPGNLRELARLCTRLAIFVGESRLVEADDVMSLLGDPAATPTILTRARQVLHETGGNASQAARILGWSRTRLYRVLGSEVRRIRPLA